MKSLKNIQHFLFDRHKPVKLPLNCIELKGIEGNYSIGNAYQRILTKLVREMFNDIIPSIEEAYRNYKPQINNIVGDSIIDNIYNLISIKMGKWERNFLLYSDNIANEFVKKINNDVNSKFIRSLSSLKTVAPASYEKFKIQISANTQRIILAKQAKIKENVGLIRNLTPKAEEQIHIMIMEAASNGKGVTYLKEQLQNIKSITENRAKLIARDQLSKVTSVLNTAKQANLGVKKAIWHHSNAGKEPRQSHIQANGKVYLISKGCWIEGEYIYPGEKINCRCYSSAVLEFDLE